MKSAAGIKLAQTNHTSHFCSFLKNPDVGKNRKMTEVSMLRNISIVVLLTKLQESIQELKATMLTKEEFEAHFGPLPTEEKPDDDDESNFNLNVDYVEHKSYEEWLATPY